MRIVFSMVVMYGNRILLDSSFHSLFCGPTDCMFDLNAGSYATVS